MKFAAVTTFNAEGLNLYGRRMMESFARHWPAEVPLRVYSEEFDGDFDLLTLSPWLTAFKARHRNSRFRDFRWDAVRFSHKVAALCHAAHNTDADVLIWLDGDIFTHSAVTVDRLESLAPKGGEWIAWLDRASMYPECGFFMLNCRHPEHMEMIGRYEGMYAGDGLFSLPEWHDSFVLQHVVKSSGVGTRSLSGQGRGTMHPLVNGPLAAFCDHLKGNRKVLGKSLKTDIKVKREEAYWQ